MNTSVFNLNTLQTILSGLLVAIPFLLKATGCVDVPGVNGADPTLECTASFLPSWAVWAALAAVSALKFVIIPWFQPGGLLYNLFAPKVPVTAAPASGTVTPAQVQP